MASTTFTQATVTGKQTMRRYKKQGAPVKSDEIKNTYTVVIHMSKQEYKRFIDAKNVLQIKNSAFGRIALFLGIESYLNQINH